MSLTRTRLRVAVRVMRYYNSVPLTGAMPVMAPVRGRANHQFTDGYDSCGRKKQAAAAGIRSGEKNRSYWTARQFSALPCTWDNP